MTFNQPKQHSEKIIVFDENGNPKELRYYEAEKLVARLGTILDAENNFIGLRELDVEEVSPPSWFEKHFFKKPQTNRISVMTVDFIGLINWIDTIAKIKLIKRANIHVIDERSIAFGSGYFDGWRNTTPTTITVEADSVLGRIVKFNASTGNLLYYVNLDTNIYTQIRYTGWQLAGGGEYSLYVGYSDASNEIWQDIASTTKTRFTHNLKLNKTLVIINVSSGLAAQADGYFAAPEIYDSEADRWIPLTSSMGTVQAEILSLPAITGAVTVTGTLTQSTKHDSKVYAPAIFDASASGNLVAAVANKVTKLHGIMIQAQGTVTVNLNNGSGGASLMEWSFQAREGATIAFAPNPAYWAITSVNTALYVTLSAAVQVTITAIISSDDAS